MKKTVEFNTKFNLGDIVYGIFNNKSVKAKITAVYYHKKDTLVRENFTNEVDYEIEPLNKTFSIYDKGPTQWYINEDDKSWFKTKDELIDYLKTQIDRITTDDYTINYEAH